ncbi:uncharacterized protein LOC144078014 isoform X2 [Stigmatopora argus]
MLAFTLSFFTFGVALGAGQMTTPGMTTAPPDFNFTTNGVSGTTQNDNVTSGNPNNTHGTVTPRPAQKGNTMESTTWSSTAMSISSISSTKMKEHGIETTTTAKPYTTTGYDNTGIIILVLIIVVAIGFIIACYISKRRARRHTMDFMTRADEANIPLSPVEPVSANDNAPKNGLQTFEFGDKKSKIEEKEEAKMEAESEPKAEAPPAADASPEKAEDGKPGKSDQAVESGKNENDSGDNPTSAKESNSPHVFQDISLTSQV